MADTLVEGDAGRATSTLLGSTTAGSQVALILYGLYLAVHVRYVSSDLYARLAFRVKVVLWAVFALLTAYSGLVFADVVHWSTTTTRSPTDILHGWPIDSVLPLLAGCVALPVQAVLALRAAALLSTRTRRYGFFVLIGLLVLVSFAGAVGTCVTGFLFKEGTTLAPREYEIAATVWLWTAALVNVTITAALAWTLSQRIAPYTEKTSRTQLWFASTIQTAGYTAVLSLAAALTSTVAIDQSAIYSLVDWAFWLPLPACYGLSLYTTLPPRRAATQSFANASTSALPLTTMLSTNKMMPDLPDDAMSVTVPTTTEPPSYTTIQAIDVTAASAIPSSKETTPTKAGYKPSRSSALYDRIEPWERRASVDDTRIPMPPAGPGGLPSGTSGRARTSSLEINRAGAAGGGATLTVGAPSRLRTGSVSDIGSDSDDDGRRSTAARDRSRSPAGRTYPATDGALRTSEGFDHR